MKEQGLSQPGGGSVSCEKSQVPAQNSGWCWASAAPPWQRLQTRQWGWACSISPLLQPCYGLCYTGLTEPSCYGGDSAGVPPSKPSCPVSLVPAPSQDQTCIFSPCSPREDYAGGALEGFRPAWQRAGACCAWGCCSSPSTIPALYSVQELCMHKPLLGPRAKLFLLLEIEQRHCQLLSSAWVPGAFTWVLHPSHEKCRPCPPSRTLWVPGLLRQSSFSVSLWALAGAEQAMGFHLLPPQLK